VASPRRSSQQRQTSPQRGTQVRKKLSLNPQQRGKESEVNLLAAWPAAPATTKDGRGGASRQATTRAGEEEEEELTELDAAMNALHDEKEEAAISEEEQAITWRGEPVASDDLHGITYRDQFALEPKGTGTFALTPLLVAASIPLTPYLAVAQYSVLETAFVVLRSGRAPRTTIILKPRCPSMPLPKSNPPSVRFTVFFLSQAPVSDMVVQSHHQASCVSYGPTREASSGLCVRYDVRPPVPGTS